MTTTTTRWILFGLLLGAAATTACTRPAPLPRDGPLLAVGLGSVDVPLIADIESAAPGLAVEWRGTPLGDRALALRPLVAGEATVQGAAYAGAGLILDAPLGRGFYVAPSFMAGLCRMGLGKDLGHDVEFRSGIELGYRLPSGVRLGVAGHHRSNANLGDRNPGEDAVRLYLVVPLRQLPRRLGTDAPIRR